MQLRDGDDGEMKYLEIVTLKEAGGRTPLYCFPGAGGAVTIFREMVSSIEADQPVDAIDMQKFFDADRQFTVEQLADLCLSAIREKQKRGPYLMCGYSFGAIVAYEVAARLMRDGEDIGVVAMVDTGNPAFRAQLSSTETQQLNRSYAANRLGKYLRILADGNIRTFADGVSAVLAARAGIKTRRLIRRAFRAINRPMPDVFRHNDRALFHAWTAYTPPPSALSLLLFYDEHRPLDYGGDRTLGWGLSTSGQVDVELASEGHVEMMKAPYVRGFAARLIEYSNGER
jgi:thioesterase domain-containing protein